MRSLKKVAGEQTTGHARHFPGCLRGASLFAHLSEKETACFDDAAQPRSHKKWHILYVQDEPAKFFYIICSGWIKLFHMTQEGEEIVIDMLTTGDIVGESAIFEGGRHTSSAQIIEDVHLLSVPANLLKEQISLNPALALNMLSSMSRQHRRHSGETALNALQSAPQRIGAFMLRLCPHDQGRNVVLHFPYDKTLIATTLGMKGATFSRALNILRKKTDIRINGARVEIDSVEQLAKFVYGPLAMQTKDTRLP